MILHSTICALTALEVLRQHPDGLCPNQLTALLGDPSVRIQEVMRLLPAQWVRQDPKTKKYFCVKYH